MGSLYGKYPPCNSFPCLVVSAWFDFNTRCFSCGGLRSTPRRSHILSYVLRNKATGDVYLAIYFTIHLKEHVDEDGNIIREDSGASSSAEAAASQGEVQTSVDDVD